MIPQQVAVGLALQATREALEGYGPLPGTRASITADVERRMTRLLAEWETAESAGRQGAETGDWRKVELRSMSGAEAGASESELWKYLAAHQDEPPVLRIVLPAALGEATVLRKLADALDRTRHMLAYHLAICRYSLDQAKDRGDEEDATLWSGQTLGIVYAIERLDGDILGELDLWDQQEKQTQEAPETIKAMADQLSWSFQRPAFTLPDVQDSTLGLRLVLLIRAQRDELIAQAVAANYRAVMEYTEEGEDPDPEYGLYMARARCYAMAADDLDNLLARAYGVQEAHEKFLDQHGTWLARLVFT